MKKAIYIIIVGVIVAIAVFLVASRNQVLPKNDKKTLLVSILPLKYIVGQIVGDDYRIEVLVPPGSSPETYEPTPQQLIDMSNADLVLTTGLIDFEHALVSKITQQSQDKVINLSDGIELLSGCCGSAGHGHNHHHHGVDPHIWTSPKQLKVIAGNAYRAIALLPDAPNAYETNYNNLMEMLDDLDNKIEVLIEASQVKYFFIYHPALTYYANDYGVGQVSVESEGKEPSADQLRNLIDLARRENIDKILYQREFSKSVMETIASDIGATPVEIDPLAEDIVKSILDMTYLITGANN